MNTKLTLTIEQSIIEKAKALKVVFKVPSSFDYKKELAKGLKDKYL